MSNKNFEISFCELRSKEVVNCFDGRRLGKITDIIFSGESGKIKGIITPYVKRNLLGKNQEIFIPWNCVKKLGEDVIIVDVGGVENGNALCNDSKDCDEKPHKRPSLCDGRCEKCMLFDCDRRWKKE